MMVRCTACLDTGHVCEEHPNLPWPGGGASVAGCDCGAAGMPCQRCCSPIPLDGTARIELAFTPDWKRPAFSDGVSPTP